MDCLSVGANPAQRLSLQPEAIGAVADVNRNYRRSGSLWEGRYRSCPTPSEDYLLACQRHIELNPVRAGRVEHLAEYRWSSYRANAQGSVIF
jgi:putative transposase